MNMKQLPIDQGPSDQGPSEDDEDDENDENEATTHNLQAALRLDLEARRLQVRVGPLTTILRSKIGRAMLINQWDL